MKNFAKLILFLGLSFIGVLILGVLLALLSDWANTALIFPPERGIFEVFTGNITVYLRSSIPVAFYLTILLGLNYAVIRRIVYPAAFAVILFVILALSGAAYFSLEALHRTGFTITVKGPPTELAQAGFITNQRVFLENPYKPDPVMALVSPGESLHFQSPGSFPTQARLPFFTEQSRFFSVINRDISHSSRVFSAWFNSGLVSYGVYAGSLAAFLLSLGCLVNISFWSLANVFFGALAFRGVLALENFLNQPHIHQIFASFAGNLFNERLISPFIFCTLSILILLYSGLVYLARGRISDG